MTAGIMMTQAELDNVIGNLARTLNRMMVEEIPLVQSKLLQLTQTGMVDLPQGSRATTMTTDDASDLMNAMNELYDLSRVYLGLKTVAEGGVVADGSGHDFTSYTKVIYGFGF